MQLPYKQQNGVRLPAIPPASESGETADAQVLGTCAERREGSTPSSRTTPKGVEAPQHSGPRRREGEEQAKTRATLHSCIQRTVKVGDGPGEVP